WPRPRRPPAGGLSPRARARRWLASGPRLGSHVPSLASRSSAEPLPRSLYPPGTACQRTRPMTKKLTTVAGAPVPDNQNTLTAGLRGPALLQDVWLLEKLAHFH